MLHQAGDPLVGGMSFWSRGNKDKCPVCGASCTVGLPTGDYSFTLVPGQKIVCKQVGDFNCSSGAYGNLDCGASDAAKCGVHPATPEDEPPPVGSPQEQ